MNSFTATAQPLPTGLMPGVTPDSSRWPWVHSRRYSLDIINVTLREQVYNAKAVLDSLLPTKLLIPPSGFATQSLNRLGKKTGVAGSPK